MERVASVQDSETTDGDVGGAAASSFITRRQAVIWLYYVKKIYQEPH